MIMKVILIKYLEKNNSQNNKKGIHYIMNKEHLNTKISEKMLKI